MCGGVDEPPSLDGWDGSPCFGRNDREWFQKRWWEKMEICLEELERREREKIGWRKLEVKQDARDIFSWYILGHCHCWGMICEMRYRFKIMSCKFIHQTGIPDGLRRWRHGRDGIGGVT